MLIKILIGAVALVVVVAAFIATRPDTFTVARARTVAAPPSTIYAQVADFHRWAAWSPWEHLDPAMQKTFGGPPDSAGATYEWKGNKQVGEGRMTITGVKPAAQVAIRLEFFKPFQSASDTTFDFAPQGAGTQVTWTMTGKHDFMSKAFSLFMNMDKMVGGDFERGLTALASVSEAEAAKSAQPAAARP